MLTDNQDAYGHLIADYYDGKEDALEIVEREDGFITASPVHPQIYFAEYPDWPEHQQRAMAYAAGRILDIGSGAGRHALYLQERGYEVLGIDNSPMAIQLCSRRGLKHAQVMPITRISSNLGPFDTLLMMGSNFGLCGSFKRARWLLKRFATLTTDTATIIAETRDPYLTPDPSHLAYHQWNRERDRMGGQIRIRVRYRHYATPWFDYLFVSKPELEEILHGTGWRVDGYLDANTSVYVAILKKLG